MSSLRDARFEKALAHAPDAGGGAAPAAVRTAIHAAAHRAVAPAPRLPWWRSILGGEGRMPWNAAFATVLLAGFVTLLWRGGEHLPREDVAVDRPAAVAVPAAREASAPPAAVAPPPSAPPAAVAAAPAAPPPAPVASPRPAPRAAVASPSATRQAEHERDVAAKAVMRREQAERQQAAATADAAEGRRDRVAPALAAPAPPSASVAAAPAPARSPAPAPLARRDFDTRFVGAPVPMQAATAQVPWWDTVRIDIDARSAVLPRPQAEALAATVTRFLSAPREPSGPAPARSVAQLTLLANTRTVGQLWLGDHSATWQPAGEAAVTWHPEAAQLAALREQVLAALPR